MSAEHPSVWKAPGFGRVALLSLAFGLVVASATHAAYDVSGFIAAELRGFLNHPVSREQLQHVQSSLVIAPEFTFETRSENHQFLLAPFLRLDDQDDERTHFDLRQAYWRRVGGNWDLLVGVDRVFWGVTESRHLVDIVNQTDTVEDIDEEDKLGQPMVAFTTLQDWGTVSLFALVGFRERTFPGSDGRLRTPLVVDPDEPVYESDRGNDRVDWAVRYSHFIGDFDLGLSYFDGTSREPGLVPSPDGESLVPHYDLIRQVGLDVQYTAGAWLWKAEALQREGHGPGFWATVIGFEYTLYQLGGRSADLGLLLEVLYDDRDPLLAPPTLFDDDVFLGARLALNDVQDTALLIGAIVDRHDDSTLLLVEAERRIGQGWKLELETRLFSNSDAGNLLASFEDDDFVTLRLSRHF